MLQGKAVTIIYTVVLALASIYFLSRGLQLRTITWIERVLLVAGALLMITPFSDEIGFIIVAAAYVIYFIIKFRKNKSKGVVNANN